MNTLFKGIGVFLCCFFILGAGYASKQYPAWKGVTASMGFGHPSNLRGIRSSVQWQPRFLNRRVFTIYFDLSAAHWWTEYHKAKRNTIFAIAPVLRIYLARQRYISPYVEASSGAAYMTHTVLATRSLGSHWTFQDLIGVGAVFGPQKHYDMSLRFLHYSNANLASPNDGIDVWFLITLGYHFNS